MPKTKDVIMFPSTLRQNISKYTTEDNLAQMVRSSTAEDSYTIKYEGGTLEFVIHGYYFKVSNVTTLPEKAYIVIDNNTSTLRNIDGSTTLDTDGANGDFTGLQFDPEDPPSSTDDLTVHELRISDGSENLLNQFPIHLDKLKEILGYTPYDSSNPENYTSNPGTVTSVRVQATSPLASSVNSAQTSTLDTTISLAANYGDTQNPYGSNKSKNLVLATPKDSGGAPGFRLLDASDIPSLDASKIISGTLDDDRIPNLSASKITSGTLGSDRIPSLDASKITTGTLPASRGGTGQTSLQATRNAMGLGNTTGALPVANGGTGCTSFTANRVIMSGTSTTGAFTTRAIDTTPTSNSDSLITSGAVYSGLAGKANSSHSHSNYLPLSGGTMTGNLVAASSSAGFRCRNVSFGTGDPSGGSVGDVYIKY